VQQVSQKGLQHAEEKGDRRTERETRKGRGQRRKRETDRHGEGKKEVEERSTPRRDNRVRENRRRRRRRRRRRTRISRAKGRSPSSRAAPRDGVDEEEVDRRREGSHSLEKTARQPESGDSGGGRV